MNYYELLIEGLKEWADIQATDKKRAAIFMLKNFVELIGEKKFNNRFNYYFMGDQNFDDGWYNFHKSMRQTDFYDIGEGHLDMLFWQFIHLTELPYQAFKTFTEKIKIGVVDEFNNDLEGSNGWDKFGFFRIGFQMV